MTRRILLEPRALAEAARALRYIREINALPEPGVARPDDLDRFLEATRDRLAWAEEALHQLLQGATGHHPGVSAEHARWLEGELRSGSVGGKEGA